MGYKYYQPDIKNLTYGELWRASNNLIEFAIAWIVKTCRISISLPQAVAYPDNLILISESAIPNHVAEKMNVRIDDVRAIGVLSEIFYTIPTLGPTECFAWIAQIQTEPGVVASISLTRTDAASYVDSEFQFGFSTLMQDGRYVSTIGNQNRVSYPSDFEFHCEKNASTQELFQIHLGRIQSDRSRPVVSPPDQLEMVALQGEQKVYDHMIQRGAFQEVLPDQLKQIRAGVQTVPVGDDESDQASGFKGWEMMFWIITGIGIFLFRSPAANQSQFIFRIAVLGVGLLGAISLMLFRLVKTQK